VSGFRHRESSGRDDEIVTSDVLVAEKIDERSE
jgi:hypothetical protein